MTAIAQAAKLYADHGLVLADDLTNYIKHGYVFITPDRVLLGRPISRECGPDHWLRDTDPADAWYVKLAVGKNSLRYFVAQIPYHLPFLAWRRNFKGDDDRLHIYPTERILNKL